FPSRLGVHPRTRAVSLPHFRVPPKPPAGPWGMCGDTVPKSSSSLGPGNSWLVFEKELDNAAEVGARAGDEVRARLEENKSRIFGADASILPALAQIVSTSETPSCDGDGACNEVLSVRSQWGQRGLSYECW